MMTVVVTGAAGFLGRCVVRELVAAGHAVRAVVRRLPATPLWREEVELVTADVTDLPSLDRAFHGAAVVIHLAAVIVERAGQTFERVNHEGTRNVISAAQGAGVQHLAHMSVMGAQPGVGSRYLLSRWLGEQAIQASPIPWTIVRASLLFGEGDAFFSALARYIRLPSPLFPIFGRGAARFHPLAADDLARCLVAVTERPTVAGGRILDLGGPQVLTYEEMVDMVMAIIGVDRWKVHVPIPLVKPAAWALEKLMTRPLITIEQLRFLELDSVAELGVVEREFGFTPTPLLEGLAYLRPSSAP